MIQPVQPWPESRPVVRIWLQCRFCRFSFAIEFSNQARLVYGDPKHSNSFPLGERFGWLEEGMEHGGLFLPDKKIDRYVPAACQNCGHTHCIEIRREPIFIRSAEVSA